MDTMHLDDEDIDLTKEVLEKTGYPSLHYGRGVGTALKVLRDGPTGFLRMSTNSGIVNKHIQGKFSSITNLISALQTFVVEEGVEFFTPEEIQERKDKRAEAHEKKKQREEELAQGINNKSAEDGKTKNNLK